MTDIYVRRVLHVATRYLVSDADATKWGWLEEVGDRRSICTVRLKGDRFHPNAVEEIVDKLRRVYGVGRLVECGDLTWWWVQPVAVTAFDPLNGGADVG